MKFLSRFMNKFKSETAEDAESDAGASHDKKVESKKPAATPQPKPPRKDEIVLDLGDFLHRIPAQLLLAGPHDLKAELRFEARYLAERIATGSTTIPLAEIYARIPAIFRGEVLATDNVEIRFPWQKIARLVATTPGETDALRKDEADSLAVKLRSKMPSRKKIGPASKAVTGSPGPVLPGRKSDASWYSKPTADPGPGNPAGDSLHEQSAKSKQQPGSTDGQLKLPYATPETDKKPPQSAPNSEPVSAAPMMMNTAKDTQEPAPVEPTADLHIPELPADLQRKVAQLKGHYERQIGELERVRKNHAAELDSLRGELEKTGELLKEQQASAEASRDLIQAAQAERDRYQSELAELEKRMASVEDHSKIVEITAERDALLKQKAHFSAQVAELSRRSGAVTKGHDLAVAAATNRQIEELQRRITHMEGAQREAALELAREKEARSKVEKMLIAADKLQEQSANYMETAKGEIRKEIEASVKVRENEFRKAQKEMLDQVNSLSDQLRFGGTELENARSRIAHLEAEQAEAARKAAKEASESEMQAKVVAQLEEDIENYRSRMKSLIGDRDTIRGELEHAKKDAGSAAELASLRKIHTELEAELEKTKLQEAKAKAAVENERTDNENRVAALRQALDAARDTHAAQITTLQNEKAAELQSAMAAVGDRAAEAARLAEERGARIGELETEVGTLTERLDALNSAQAKSLEELASLAELRETNSALTRQLESLTAERDNSAELLRKSAASHKEIIATLNNEQLSIVRANEELRKRVKELERDSGALETLRAQIKDADLQLADAISQRDDARAALASEMQSAASSRRELDAAREEINGLRNTLQEAKVSQADHARLATDLTNALAEKARLAEAFATERESLQSARDGAERAAAKEAESHQRKIAELEAGRKSLAAELDAAKREIGQVRGAFAAMEADLESARKVHASVVTELASARKQAAELAKSSEQTTAIAQELEILRAGRETHSRTLAEAVLKQQSLAEALESERAALQLTKENAARQAAAEAKARKRDIADRDERLDSLTAELKSAKRELEDVGGALAAMSADLTTTRKMHADGIAALAAERRQSAAQRKEMQASFDDAEKEIATEREARAREKAAAEEEMRTLATRLEKAVSDLATARSLYTTEIASVRAEATKAARTHGELARRIARITDEHRQILEELYAESHLHSVDAVHAENADFREPTAAIVPEMVPDEPAKNLKIPLVRPVSIPPPLVQRG